MNLNYATFKYVSATGHVCRLGGNSGPNIVMFALDNSRLVRHESVGKLVRKEGRQAHWQTGRQVGRPADSLQG